MLTQESAILFILVGTAVIPFISRLLRIPSATLEIAFGFLAFNFFLDHRPEWFLVLEELGFIFLMFVAGMELDIPHVMRSGRALWYALLPLLSFVLTPILFIMLGLPFFLGLAVAMISAGIAIPVLKESRLAHTPLGHAIAGVALIGELFSILTLTLIDAYHKHGATWEAAMELGKLAALLGLAWIGLKLLYFLAWWHPDKVAAVMESKDPVEEGIRTVITVAFIGAVLAMAAGTEPILGSFLAGTIFSFVFRTKGRFEEKINAVGFGFLIPFFFVGVGSQLDKTVIASLDTVLHALFLAFMVLVSNLLTYPLARPLGIRYSEAGAMALLISAPLPMLVVTGALGMKLGLLSPQINSVLVLTTLLASLIYPSLFRIAVRSNS